MMLRYAICILEVQLVVVRSSMLAAMHTATDRDRLAHAVHALVHPCTVQTHMQLANGKGPTETSTMGHRV
jgi:hypothetical protein